MNILEIISVVMTWILAVSFIIVARLSTQGDLGAQLALTGTGLLIAIVAAVLTIMQVISRNAAKK